MAPIPIYSSSPINTATKASGITPQTATAPLPTEGQAPATTTATSTAAGNGYMPAQPGAAPSQPAPTGTATASQRYAPVQPTPTVKDGEDQGPPAPQPGAVPVPPSSTGRTVPPPPRAGQAYQAPEPTAPPERPYPVQMGIPPPTIPSAQRGTATASANPFTGSTVQPARLAGFSPAAGNYDHPPGYQQDANASELTSNQRAAQQALMSDRVGQGSGIGGSIGGGGGGEGEEGVWDAAKRWAQAAGDKLSAAESEVWRRINKE